MDSIIFCNRDLQRESFAAFENMRRRGQFCDFTINVQNRMITAHRNIVAAAIPGFQSLFTSDASVAERGILLEDLDPGALECLIDFAYSGKVSISTRNAHSLLMTSQSLQLDQVRDACVQFITERLDTRNISLACSVNNPKLTESCSTWIRNNFEEFSQSADFGSLPLSCIKTVISDDNLNVPNEEIVFQSVIKWIKKSPSERHVVLPDLMSEVRMIYLTNEFFMDKICCEALIKNSAPCRDLIDEVKNYHLVPERRASFTSLRTRPRNCWKQLYVSCFDLNCGYSVYHFDSNEESWTVVAGKELQCEILKSVVAVNENIFMFFDQTVQKYSPTAHEWEVLKPKHEGIEGTAIVAFGSRIYCFGSGYPNFLKKMRCFDSKRNEWLREEQMQTERSFSAAASFEEECIYVIGGNDGSRKCLKTVEKYRPSVDEWSRASAMLTPRWGHSCTSMNRKVFVCGGYTAKSNELNTAEVYDPEIDQWNYISPMKNKMATFALLSHCNKIHALGKVGEVYDPKTDQWKAYSSLPGQIIGAVSVATTS